MPSLSILFAQICNKEALNHSESNEKDDLASCGKAVFLLNNSRFYIHSASQSTSISKRKSAICSGVRCFFFSQGCNKPLKNKDFLSSGFHSHSMLYFCFVLIHVLFGANNGQITHKFHIFSILFTLIWIKWVICGSRMPPNFCNSPR